MLKGKHILLGVTGSIAAYKALDIVSLLKLADPKSKTAKATIMLLEKYGISSVKGDDSYF